MIPIVNRLLLPLCVVPLLVGGASAQSPRTEPPRAAKLVDVLEVLHGGAKREIFIEGPSTDAVGRVQFTDEAHQPESRILQWDPVEKKLTVWREKAGRANGMTRDAVGRLIACEGSRAPGGNRRVVRYEPDGSLTVLADRYDGKRLNSPNDAVVDGLGRVWFTDPRYVGERADLEQDCEGVYRIDEPGTERARVVRVAGADKVKKPNGVALSPDGRTLYVADNPVGVTEKRLLLAFPIAEDGSLGAAAVLHDFGANRGIDGMRVDRAGRIYATAGSGDALAGAAGTGAGQGDSGIWVFDPRGSTDAKGQPIPGASAKKYVVPLPETPGNCGWGGPDGRSLFVTASQSLYEIRFGPEVVGYGVFPPKWPSEK